MCTERVYLKDMFMSNAKEAPIVSKDHTILLLLLPEPTTLANPWPLVLAANSEKAVLSVMTPHVLTDTTLKKAAIVKKPLTYYLIY